jgi:phage terminase small subunit
MALSKKHRAFIEEYLATFNATEAYHRVYAPETRETAAVNGHRLLRNANVEEAIKCRLSESAMLADEVLGRLTEHARGSIGEFTRIVNGAPIFDFEAASKANKMHLIKKLKTKTRSYLEGKGEDARLVSEVDVEFELYDAQAALMHLGKHHKLFTEQQDVNLTGELHVIMDR